MSDRNGDNDFGVTFSRITFFQRILDTHNNVVFLERHDDIVFEIERKSQGDRLSIVCVDEYTVSLELVMRVIQTFSKIDILFVGGKWNGYTREAYEFCQEREMGIYNAGEIAGGLYKDEFWTYEKFDKDGNSTKSIKA